VKTLQIKSKAEVEFSCLISCYHKDSALQLSEALDSLLKQTVQATEIIVVEDGILSNNLYSTLGQFEKRLPIKRVQIKKNQGLGNALNQGLKQCSYDIVMRMDTDDICQSQRFEKQIEFLQKNPDVSIVGSWAKDINGDGKIIGERTFPTNHDEIVKIIWSCPFAHPTIAFRKSAIIEIGSYRTDIKRRQDYELWMRAAANGLKFANIPEFLLYYRFTEEYYKKNNFKVAWSQAKMGLEGLRNLKENRIYPYIAVFLPVFRSILPGFVEKPVHRLLRNIDPRRQKK